MSYWLTAAGGLVAALPALRELRRRPRNARLRAQAPGSFADLSQGVTHYDWLGPERGPVAVCVHGLTTPSFVWLGLARRLVAMGYRVLVYDLYGRGYSAAPRGLQTPGVFSRQLTDLLDHEGLTDDITLIGYSMGGAISAHWASENGHRLRRLILLAPAGMGHELGAMARWAVEWPVLGDWLFHMAYPTLFRKAAEAERNAASSVEDISDLQIGELDRRGFVRSVLSSLRGTLRRSAEAAHREIHATHLPVTAIWARDDKTIPLRAMGQLTQWNRDVRQVVIEEAGHGLTYTHADAVAQAIAETWDGPVI
ncbi:alpha/beta fold hydrolase [Sagittula sp. S175]|uniref:alpha/beta fold hydrolase n=1 Tax=Sagittula sp. S175 TaxID=3415129 RepID=UPI003C7D11D3